MSASPLVRCRDVSRTYGSGLTSVVALYGATCDLRPEDKIALVGPSGSGKSTLLHLMAGLETPTGGELSWPALGTRATLRPGPVGIVFQGPSLLPALDVAENVALPLLLDGHDRAAARTRAHESLARLGLDDLAVKLPEELSGGQAQRVAVARALVGQPRLLLADEPTGQLDHANARIVVDVLLAAAAQVGAALVISTHDPTIAERLAQRWDIADGRLDTHLKAAGTSEAGTPCSA